MDGNQENRVERPISLVSGPLAGQELLEKFKEEIIKERLFQIMFGNLGERVFIKQMPSLNETILPLLILSWKNENFKSSRVYLEGSISANLILPVRLTGDYNALRRVASMIQRWMGGGMQLFDKVPGLTHFGYGTDYNYEGMAKFDGFSCPVIQMGIPFKFDLTLLRQQVDGFDPNAPLDDAEMGWVEEYLLEAHDSETAQVVLEEGVILETGQTN